MEKGAESFEDKFFLQRPMKLISIPASSSLECQCSASWWTSIRTYVMAERRTFPRVCQWFFCSQPFAAHLIGKKIVTDAVQAPSLTLGRVAVRMEAKSEPMKAWLTAGPSSRREMTTSSS